jgi:hypothetical protein
VTEAARKGEVRRMTAGSIERLALVISSDMFNLDSGLGPCLDDARCPRTRTV